MGRKIGAGLLFAVAAFMTIGYTQADLKLSAPATIVAILISVVMPAVGGLALLRGTFSARPAVRMEALRRQTIDAEILRFAMQQKGRLTAVEVTSSLGLAADDTSRALDDMVRRELAELEVSDDGVLVYTFHDARYLDGKKGTQRFLD